jgi:hypothetical protein
MESVVITVVALAIVVSVAQAQVTKEAGPGITNLSRLETTGARAVTPSAVA